jgi:type II secretory pathway predicted ATPase ExeA
MYLLFYELRHKPFQISTNPSFLWLGKMHKEALALLKYGILENKGFLLLTGDVGTGKTTLINALTNSLGDGVIVAKIPDPGLELIDFMNYISHAFDMEKKFVCKEAFLIHFGKFLHSAAAAGKKVLLIIDESQRLSSDLLEEIRQLSNIEKQESKLLNILFVGHNEFNDVLLEQRNRALHQRIAINYALGSLDFHETGEFIRQSLKMAGAEKDIFSPDAILSVYEFSSGCHRKINIICDHALLNGFVRGTKTVTGDMVRECANDLYLPGSTEKANITLPKFAEDADFEKLKEVPIECLQEIASTHVWRTVAKVVLGAVAVFLVILVNYSREWQNLFFLIKNSGIQAFSILREIQAPDENINSASYRETSLTQPTDKISEVLVFDVGPTALPVVKGLLVEKVESVGVVSKDQSPDAPRGAPASSMKKADLRDTQPAEENIVVRAHSPTQQMSSMPPSDQQKEIRKENDSNVYSELEEYLTQKTRKDHPDESINPANPGEGEDGLTEDPENVDPGAVIDWILENRSK